MRSTNTISLWLVTGMALFLLCIKLTSYFLCQGIERVALSSKRVEFQPEQLHPVFIYPQLYRCPSAKKPDSQPGSFRSQSNEDRWLYDKIFSLYNTHSKGIFLEIGALDGETFSNTWFFEKVLDWRGVLIEGLPSNQPRLRSALRGNSAVFTTGICQDNPGLLTFTDGGGAVGGTKEYSTENFLLSWHGSKDAAVVRSACVPLRLILASTGIRDIDLFSLDVEGAELAVLETIDWEKTNIHVILVEMDESNKEKDQRVRELLISKGFADAKGSYGSVRDACDPHGDCTMNEVFINSRFFERKQPPAQQYVYGTGVLCSEVV